MFPEISAKSGIFWKNTPRNFTFFSSEISLCLPYYGYSCNVGDFVSELDATAAVTLKGLGDDSHTAFDVCSGTLYVLGGACGRRLAVPVLQLVE